MSKWAKVNRARARKPKGTLSGPARAFAALLALRQAAGEVSWWRVHPGSLRLAEGVRYEPDFAYVNDVGEVAYVEVKGPRGFGLDAESRTKWRAAGDLFPWARFEAVVMSRGGLVVSTEVYEPALGAARVREDREDMA